MVITIYKGDEHTILLGSKDARFKEAWGDVVKVSTSIVYTQLMEIAKWANNTLNEECLFEVD